MDSNNETEVKSGLMEDISEPSVDHLTAAAQGMSFEHGEPKAVDSSEEETEGSKEAAAWKEETAVADVVKAETKLFASMTKEPSTSALASVASRDNTGMNGSSSSFGEDVSDNKQKKVRPSDRKVKSAPAMRPGAVAVKNDDTAASASASRPSDGKRAVVPAMVPGAVAVSNDDTKSGASAVSAREDKVAAKMRMGQVGVSAVPNVETVEDRVAAKLRRDASGGSKPGAQAESGVGSSTARARQSRYENKMRNESSHSNTSNNSNGGDDRSALSSSQTSQPGVVQSNIGVRGLRKGSRTKDARSSANSRAEDISEVGSDGDLEDSSNYASQPGVSSGAGRGLRKKGGMDSSATSQDGPGSRAASKSEDQGVSEKRKAFNMGGVEGMEEHFLSKKQPGASQSQVWRDNLKAEENEKANMGLGAMPGMSEKMLSQSKLKEESYIHDSQPAGDGFLIEATLVEDDPEAGKAPMMDPSQFMIAEAVEEQEGVFMTKKKMFGACFLLVAILVLSIAIPCGLGACSEPPPPPPPPEQYCSLDNYTLWLVDYPESDAVAPDSWIATRPGSDDPWALEDGDVICTSDITPGFFNVEALVTCDVQPALVEFFWRAPLPEAEGNWPPHFDRDERGWPYFTFGNTGENYEWIDGKPFYMLGGHSLTTIVHWVLGEEIKTIVGFDVIDCTDCNKCDFARRLQANETEGDLDFETMMDMNMTNMTDSSEFDDPLRSPEPDCRLCERRQKLYFS